METLIYLHTFLTSQISRNAYKANPYFFETKKKKQTNKHWSWGEDRMWLSVYSQKPPQANLWTGLLKVRYIRPSKCSLLSDRSICHEQSIPSPWPLSISRTGRPQALGALSPCGTETIPAQEKGVWPNPAAAQRAGPGYQPQTSQQWWHSGDPCFKEIHAELGLGIRGCRDR